MLNKELTQEIDKAFEDFYDQLDRNLFGLYINPSPLRPKDDVKTGRKFKEQEEEELIFAKDDLQKMNVLRRIISSMGTMDAIEFLLSKLKNTKNNADFFVSMNKPAK